MRRRRRQFSLTRAAERLDRHHLALGIGVAALAVATAVLSVMAIDGLPFTNPDQVKAIVPADAPIVRPGDEVRVAGQRVGEVRDVDSTQQGREVSMDVDDTDVTQDASATVRLRGLAGAVYIQLDPGDGASAPDGWTIPASRTGTGTQLTDVVAAFDRQTRGALSQSLVAYGAGMAGRGQDLNQALSDLPPTLERGTPLLRAANPSPGALSGLVGGASATLHAAAGNREDDVAGLVSGASGTLGATAAESGALSDAIHEAPGAMSAARQVLPEADPLLDDLTRASRALSPGARALATALPDVNALLANRPALDRLSDLARKANGTVDKAIPVLRDLRPGLLTFSPLLSAAEPLTGYVGRFPGDVLAGPTGFTTWGDFSYDDGQAAGHRAVRFTPVFTCAPGRNPYPGPNQAGKDRESCF
jgi:phospholipid/cholesterol/gamma-HCH transport system substrate-binding protein